MENNQCSLKIEPQSGHKNRLRKSISKLKLSTKTKSSLSTEQICSETSVKNLKSEVRDSQRNRKFKHPLPNLSLIKEHKALARTIVYKHMADLTNFQPNNLHKYQKLFAEVIAEDEAYSDLLSQIQKAYDEEIDLLSNEKLSLSEDLKKCSIQLQKQIKDNKRLQLKINLLKKQSLEKKKPLVYKQKHNELAKDEMSLVYSNNTVESSPKTKNWEFKCKNLKEVSLKLGELDINFKDIDRRHRGLPTSFTEKNPLQQKVRPLFVPKLRMDLVRSYSPTSSLNSLY